MIEIKEATIKVGDWVKEISGSWLGKVEAIQNNIASVEQPFFGQKEIPIENLVIDLWD